MKNQTVTVLVLFGVLALMLIANATETCGISMYFAKFKCPASLAFLGFTGYGVVLGVLIGK